MIYSRWPKQYTLVFVTWESIRWIRCWSSRSRSLADRTCRLKWRSGHPRGWLSGLGEIMSGELARMLLQFQGARRKLCTLQTFSFRATHVSRDVKQVIAIFVPREWNIFILKVRWPLNYLNLAWRKRPRRPSTCCQYSCSRWTRWPSAQPDSHSDRGFEFYDSWQQLVR